MTKIGFELEINSNSDIPRRDYHGYDYFQMKNFKWRFERDGSLSEDGVEIISEAFSKSQLKKIKEDLLDIMVFTYSGRWWIDNKCGFHINFSYKNVSRDFLFSRLLFLRKSILKWISENYPDTKEEFIGSYFRSYAKEIKDYSYYKIDRYLEFNIKKEYIEWRSVNLRHLKKITKTPELVNEIVRLLEFLFSIIEKSKKIKIDKNQSIYKIRIYEEDKKQFSRIKEFNEENRQQCTSVVGFDYTKEKNDLINVRKIKNKIKKTNIKIKFFGIDLKSNNKVFIRQFTSLTKKTCVKY